MGKHVKYTKNLVGTDYVCGDIHGCYGKLEQQLYEVGFNKSKDRLFVLGDLIDRGPQSDRALEYLSYPWFISIMGNHELMLLCALMSGTTFDRRKEYHELWAWNGGDWWDWDCSSDVVDQWIDALYALPMAITLEVGNGVEVGLVHADVEHHTTWPQLVDRIDTICDTGQVSCDVKDWSTNPTVEMLLWQRDRFNLQRYGVTLESIPGIDHVFFGHSIVKEITTRFNYTFMDTGSFQMFGDISIINLPFFLKSNGFKTNE